MRHKERTINKLQLRNRALACVPFLFRAVTELPTFRPPLPILRPQITTESSAIVPILPIQPKELDFLFYAVHLS